MSGPYATALVALVITAWLALYVLLRKKFAAHSLALGSACVLLLAAAAASWFAAGASYVFVWPVAAALLGALLTSARRTDNGFGIGTVLLLCVLAVPAVLIVGPLAQAFFVTMGLASESGLAIAVVTITGLGALVLPVEVIVERRRWWPAGVALLVALAAVGVGALLTRHSERHPKPANVLYVLDADAGQACWAVKIDRPDPWFRQFLGPSPRPGRPPALVPPWSSVTGIAGFLQNDAPVLDLPAPRAALLSAVLTDGGRNVSFRATPGREGHSLSVWVNGAPALDVSVDGRRIDGPPVPRAPDDTAWTLEYANAPASGVTVAMTLKGSQPLTVAVAERTYGLPVQPGTFVYTSRPGSLFPIQAGDHAIVRRTYTF
jgi:MFS family permease